ncbi:MAG: NUDIX domain-containing protein [Prevotella sp.]|nr:NUDIX domain-containing protein [Prevotella sp.]
MSKKHNTYPLAIHIFFIKENQVLLSLRKNTGYEDGKYSVVAGHVEARESIIDAGIREAKEETGVDITPSHFHIVGSMHRKSDDERIDYFAIVKHWGGEFQNCEKNKCGGLHWYPINNLPQNIIPYIKFAINKTFVTSQSLWYEEFGWNTYYELEEVRRQEILSNRGIIDKHRDLNNVYAYIFDSIYMIDRVFRDDGKRERWIEDLKKSIHSNKILIGTPILQNFNSKSNCVLSACTILIPPVNHKGEIVYWELERQLESQLRMGMGVGIDLSDLADPDKAVNKIDMILYKIDESLRENSRRPVAVILTLKSNHPKVKEFINCRKNKNRETTKLNISILIDDKTPYGDLENCITDSINSCGEPGILFSDRIEKENDTPQWQYNCTAPCAEVAMTDGDACHFSYLNLSEYIVYKNNIYEFDESSFINSIYTLVRFLDDIVEYSLNHCSKGNYELMRKKRRIGVGIAGFATMLIKLGIAYNSSEGLSLAKRITSILSIHTKIASIELAKYRGTFPAFNISRYKDKEWLNRKFILLGSSREQIVESILKYGIRNATTLTFPPTGTSSQIAGVSPSFEPYLKFKLCYNGHEWIPRVIFDYIISKYSSNEAGELIAQLLRDEIDLNKYKEFVSATQIDINTQLEYTKIFQDVSDGSASKTINLPESATIDDIKDCLKKAKTLELKGITIYKNKCKKI